MEKQTWTIISIIFLILFCVENLFLIYEYYEENRKETAEEVIKEVEEEIKGARELMIKICILFGIPIITLIALIISSFSEKNN